jgi:hypothetical protein
VDAQIASDGTAGVVRDAEGEYYQVTITAVSPTVPGTHVTVSESDGRARFLNPSPGPRRRRGTARLREHTRQGVETRAGLTSLDIVLTLERDRERYRDGDSPLLETQKPIQAVNIAAISCASCRCRPDAT